MAPRSIFKAPQSSPLLPTHFRLKEEALAKAHRLHSFPESIMMHAPEKNQYVLSPWENEFAFVLDALVAGFQFPFPVKMKKALKFLLLAPLSIGPQQLAFSLRVHLSLERKIL